MNDKKYIDPMDEEAADITRAIVKFITNFSNNRFKDDEGAIFNFNATVLEYLVTSFVSGYSDPIEQFEDFFEQLKTRVLFNLNTTHH